MGFGSYLPFATPTGSWWLAAAATWEMAGSEDPAIYQALQMALDWIAVLS
ncbi:hypothetical protein L195_g048109 [Trifolium pratense]|uniref:Uncharacterized protein n=1 Tax=Trifolium pratense TaxID=57577 RepID=A0A2K3JKD3_TRIPR|nr:hypothetical protein L195_g048109 [Trifolium pratense]